ncbi:MAG: cytochrome c family protein, partial [Anaerolineales bacterium]|nr:cytochrome c family protein [Anaerolineales bacterium]
MFKKILILCLTLLGLALIVASCATPTPEVKEVKVEVTREVTVTQVVEVKPNGGIPYEELWKGSAHNAVDTEPFRHWDGADPAEVPTACARCHTTAGYQDYLGADGSEALKVDKAVPAAESQGIQCVACHNPVTTFQLTSVAFPGKDDEGNTIVISGLGDAARCMVCHQGRESKASVDAQIEQFKVTDVDAVVAPIKNDQGQDVRFGFRNIHYFAAAATLYGTYVKGGYEYEGKLYDAKHDHVAGYDTCIGCHDQHTLKVKVDQCAECHGEGVKEEGGLQNIRMPQASAWDYDGDGDVEEGMYYEIQGLQESLLAAIQAYAKDTAGAGIVYDPAAYPYFLLDADGDGQPDKNDQGANIGYNAWTARLLKAAYNYQVSIKDPGSFAHGNKYIVQLLYDSIEDISGDVSALARNDAGHFAGNTLPFRDWDDTGLVPFRCVKCHTATGLPEFIKNSGTVVFDSRGNTLTAGLGARAPNNGFACVTCHDGANFPERYQVASVPFPSGATIGFEKDADGKFVPNDSNLCIECHQGRESTSSVNNALRGKDADTVDAAISFKNIHYFAA